MSITEKICPYVGLAGALLGAYGLDQVVNVVKQAGVKSFVLTPYLWTTAIANLVLAFILSGLFLLVYIKNTMSRKVSLVFLVVGGLLTFYPALAASLRFLKLPLNGLININSRLFIASSFVSVNGVIGLTASLNSQVD